MRDEQAGMTAGGSRIGVKGQKKTNQTVMPQWASEQVRYY
jgi:hypothetical protein